MDKQGQNSFHHAVTVEQMATSREDRAKHQADLLKQYAGTLVCFTMNMPGEIKSFPLLNRAFEEGCVCLEKQIEKSNIRTAYKEIDNKITGDECYYIFDADANAIKQIAMEIEDGHALGRLFDFDVLFFHKIEKRLLPLNGIVYGRKERTCLICGEPVWTCARSRRHLAKELKDAVILMLTQYFFELYAEKLSVCAARAMLYEVCTTPKPGLVDQNNSGAHKDMDLFTFIDSTCALSSYFKEIAKFAMCYQGEPANIRKQIRFRGKQAEDTMYSYTNGVNTHKGLIFTMGSVCVAAGYMFANKLEISPESLLLFCKEICADTMDELDAADNAIHAYDPEATEVVEHAKATKQTEYAKAVKQTEYAKAVKHTKTTACSHGLKAYRNHQIQGVRGEAAKGFPNVILHGYPILCQLLKQGVNKSDAGVITLLHLIANVEDTNIVHRGGYQALREIQCEIKDRIGHDSMDSLLHFAQELDQRFTLQGISPGGAADMLALTWFLFLLFD
ncbi:citrate lyase holo-[acyl-carrier protein] synthase [Lachnospiraceae bacterium ZAX-1]